MQGERCYLAIRKEWRKKRKEKERHPTSTKVKDTALDDYVLVDADEAKNRIISKKKKKKNTNKQMTE